MVHLGEVSNDPVGALDERVTYRINHEGTVRLAELAKRAGVERFVQMSSCSVYGVSGDRPSTEGDPVEPLTAYAGARCWSRRLSATLADDDFSPVFLRNATVYGASPRQRFDLVVNDLAATAYLYKEIRMTSDGTPWRPFVHVLDVAAAVSCVLDAPREVVHGEIFNVGSSGSNYQIRQIAQIVGGLVPGCVVSLGDSSADKRNYRIDFTQDRDDLARLRVPVGRRARRRRAARRVRPHRARRADVPVARLHAARPDPPPARHGADRRRLVLDDHRVTEPDAVAVTACRSCGGRELREVLSLGSTPIANALVDPARRPRRGSGVPTRHRVLRHVRARPARTRAAG